MIVLSHTSIYNINVSYVIYVAMILYELPPLIDNDLKATITDGIF